MQVPEHSWIHLNSLISKLKEKEQPVAIEGSQDSVVGKFLIQVFVQSIPELKSWHKLCTYIMLGLEAGVVAVQLFTYEISTARAISALLSMASIWIKFTKDDNAEEIGHFLVGCLFFQYGIRSSPSDWSLQEYILLLDVVLLFVIVGGMKNKFFCSPMIAATAGLIGSNGLTLPAQWSWMVLGFAIFMAECAKTKLLKIFGKINEAFNECKARD